MESSLDTSQLTRHLSIVRNEVRALRTELGWSQAELAEALGVSRQTVNAIEAGRWTPSLPLAFAIGRCFDRRIEEVFHDEDGR
jgi:putative transcriptional regulator